MFWSVFHKQQFDKQNIQYLSSSMQDSISLTSDGISCDINSLNFSLQLLDFRLRQYHQVLNQQTKFLVILILLLKRFPQTKREFTTLLISCNPKVILFV